MAKTKIAFIDELFKNPNAPALDQTNAAEQPAAVGIVQELLTCQGVPKMPDVRSPYYGKLGSQTQKRIKEFRAKHGLSEPNVAKVDHSMLRRLVEEPAVSPRASPGYLALALDFEMTGLRRVLSFVALAEGAGKFTAFNENTDKQGLSYGIIQWAQKPKRLVEIVRAFQGAANTPQRALFEATFGAAANQMVAHSGKPFGGVNKETGKTTDDNFNLIKSPWKECFINAGLNKLFQKIQIQVAEAAFQALINDLRTYIKIGGVPIIRSERGYGFMIDLGNQHGQAGAKRIFQTKVTSVVDEDAAMLAMTEESVRIVSVKYPPKPPKLKSNEQIATELRRKEFRETLLLSPTTDFNEN